MFPETDWLKYRANATPAHPALVWREHTWTYAQLDQDVQTLAGRLHAAGLRNGQRAALLVQNNPDHILLIHALMRLGVTMVPLNLRLTGDELHWQLEHSACDWLLHDKSTTAQADGIQTTRAHHLALETLPDADSISPRAFDLAAPLVIIHTSGTTGHPKGAVQTLGNHFYSAIASAFRSGTQPDDRWLLTIPLYHVGGLAILLRCCLYGTTVVLPSNLKFNAASLLDDIKQQGITLVSLVPTMLQRMLEVAPELDFFSNLRLILLGGAATPHHLLEKACKFNIPIALTYGLTEAASQVATSTPDQTRAKPGCVGSPLMFTSIRIVDAHDEPLPSGQIGEIVVSGPTVMSGYDSNPQATAQALRNGALHTGDLGYLDDDGDLWVLTRRTDLIVSGGENVYPSEVERVLLTHPSIREACVVGVDEELWGQRVSAMITLHPGANTSSDELQTFCRQHLAGYKLPREIRLVDTLPQTASGKIQRSEVQKFFITEKQA